MGAFLVCCSAIGFFIQLTYISIPWKLSQYFGYFSIVMYSASMFASSFVENEHMTWYYLLQTMMVISLIYR